MTVIDALILGVVEGLTEFLPISSTGHLILVSHALGIPDTDLLKTFEIAIQLGAIAAVIVLYWRSFLNIEVIKRLIAAFIPTAVIGLIFYSFIKTYLIGNEVVVLIALAVGGAFIIVFELLHKESPDATEDIARISYKQAIGVGLFQSVAMIPGVSRSAASIIGGLLLGFKRTTIVQFSFLLAVPTMAAATGLDLIKNYELLSLSNITIIGAGFVTAFLVAVVVMKFFLQFVRNHTFIPFGIYRIGLALLFWMVLL